jgi:molecular chaperone DnaK
VPQIEVTFDIDANGILKVTAADKASGRSQHITLTASSGLSKEDVEKMRQEAESHAADDKKRRDLIEAKNNADNSIYGAEKILSENGDKVPDEIKAEVRAAVDEVRKVKDGEDEAAIRKAVDGLSQSVQKISTAAYQQTPPSEPEAGLGGPDHEAGPNEPGSQAGPDVVDGEAKDK